MVCFEVQRRGDYWCEVDRRVRGLVVLVLGRRDWIRRQRLAAGLFAALLCSTMRSFTLASVV